MTVDIEPRGYAKGVEHNNIKSLVWCEQSLFYTVEIIVINMENLSKHKDNPVYIVKDQLYSVDWTVPF